MKLYNTLTKKVEEFIPYNKEQVTMYTCGPTVYHYAHLGNMRTYIAEDLFEKTLNYLGYHVKRAMNITDVGHLQSDGDTGEDKMAIAMKREHKTSKEVAEYYTKAFFEDLDLLNVKRPEIVVPATSMIPEYIELISGLIDNGYAYVSDGNVYFDTAKYKDYYKLSGRRPEELFVAVRDGIEEDANKRNPFDFGLWFTNSKFDNQELKWDSPWGVGYPGWHIECSTIALKNLGEYLDLHFGAEDAVFPHHSNEIAQSEGYLGHKWCNYWVHLSFLNVNDSKMSKSKGDILRAKTLKDIGYNPLAYRYFILNTYYHKQVNFTFDTLDSAEVAYKKLKNKVLSLSQNGELDDDVFKNYDSKFKDAISDDLNTANAITLLHDLLKDDNVNSTTKIALIQSWEKVLSLDLFVPFEKELTDISEEYILDMIHKRSEAKAIKNFSEADCIREELLSKGIRLKDTREGTTYEIIKK